MTITTKFGAGDKVFIINNSSVVQLEVAKVIVEQTRWNKEALIVYHFDNPDSSQREFYRYESEVGATVDELITVHAKQFQPKKLVTDAQRSTLTEADTNTNEA